MRVLIIGCGYVGLPLGRILVEQGHTVVGIRRSPESHPELRAAGIEPVHLDITRAEDFGQLSDSFDWIVNTAASTHGAGPEEYRAVYHSGTRNLLAWMAGRSLRKYVYTSSTSVYGQDDGALVKETSPTLPLASTAQVLLETESLLRDAVPTGFPAVILRVAGIYGPDRGQLLKQFLINEARIPGQGLRFLNMIHRDDLVGVIIAALQNGRPGEIYNAVDDEPVAQVHFFRWLSETLGKWMPPFGPAETEADRKRGLTNKKVSNRKLTMELGYRFKYPTFRQGYTAELKRLADAGLLEIAPDPR